MIITSPQNPKIKALVALRRRRDRQEANVMLVEGYEELTTALNSGAWPKELYYCPELMADAAQLQLLDRVAGTGALELSRAAFEKAAYREGPDGWLAVFPAVETRLDRLQLGERPLILVCEAVEKPGNLGAMLRTADAVGADAVIAPAAVTDWSNPNIVRASKGAIFTVPVAEAEPQQLLDWLAARQITLLAATPEATANYWDVDMTGGVAIAVGAEKQGLSPLLMERAGLKVLIPMQGQINSLNVATSGALLLYEAARQRRS
ncbi:MAG TPA: RNA methyltransferase [Candidatus Saccharimonadia bacterium]|nr:RNA methyltransferase [Candidatus Saccharimonadia bacterium]